MPEVLTSPVCIKNKEYGCLLAPDNLLDEKNISKMFYTKECQQCEYFKETPDFE